MNTADLRADLTPQQEQFCVAFVWHCDAQRAYRECYNVSDPEASWHKSEAWKLLQKPEIRARVEELREMKREFVAIDAAWLVEQLRKNYEQAMREVEVLDREGNGIGEYQYQGAVANKALELLGRHIGAFTDKVEQSGTVVYVPYALDPAEAQQRTGEQWEAENEP
ncbi:MAG: terminase small subunit [Gammaproteobacteria bacterium]